MSLISRESAGDKPDNRGAAETPNKSGCYNIRSGGKIVPHLFMRLMAHIVLQRKKAGRAGIKVGIAYQGRQEASKDRYRVNQKNGLQRHYGWGTVLGKLLFCHG